jgi:hypothetical protein
MVKVHEARGYRFYFYEGEVANEPPHIHIKGEKGRMKVWLFSLEIASCRGVPPHEQNKLLEIVENNHQTFLKK